MARVTRLRHMRHGRLSRLTRAGSLLSWLAARVTALTGTGATTAFTADNTTNTLTATAHGFPTGTGPMKLATIGSLPTGLATTVDYWVINLTANTFQLATSARAAARGSVVSFTTDGSGTLTIARAANDNSAIREWLRRGHRPERIDAVSDIDSL